MTRSVAASELRDAQQAWAATGAVEHDEQGYCTEVDRNLFGGLSADARADFEQGDGGEIGTSGKRGKLSALHSSSALACNVFDYWRHRDPAPLAAALSLPPIEQRSLTLEQKFPTGVGPNSPNLDAAFRLTDGTVVAVESKFCEPLGGTKGPISAKYIRDEGKGRWAAVGLEGCESLARRLHASESDFEYLDVAQLLKHMLGLASQPAPWLLIYLSYPLPGSHESAHRAEFERFTAAIGDDAAHVRGLGYQDVFQRLVQAAGPADAEYLEFLGARYFRATM